VMRGASFLARLFALGAVPGRTKPNEGADHQQQVAYLTTATSSHSSSMAQSYRLAPAAGLDAFMFFKRPVAERRQ
jgi:hypothetical protein